MPLRICRSKHYNWNFDTKTGFFQRWGETLEDDPQFARIGPEIADIEITTICHGVAGKVCPYCYKSNNLQGENMSFDTFKHILDRLPKNLTQIAFGTDASCTANPDIWKMMEYCRSKDVVPNLTVADISDETADKLAAICGAVAVTQHGNKDVCYNSIKKLTDRGLAQTNMHIVLSEETYELVLDTIKDIKNDERLKNLNAVVFLSLKQKGRGASHHVLSNEHFQHIIEIALKEKINFGMDTCTAPKFTNVLKCIKSEEEVEFTKTLIEPCESTCFSVYINVKGQFFPCSFTEGVEGWDNGIDMTIDFNFIKDVWFNDRTVLFRNSLINNLDGNNMRCCPVFKL